MRTMISKRARSIDSSGIRKVFDLAAKLKDPVNLSIGQPDFSVPETIKTAAKQAIDENRNGYTVTQGIPELRQKLRTKHGISETNTELDVFVTSGVSGGLFLAFCAMLDPGDEVLVPDPYFVMYRDLAVLIGAAPVYYDCYPDFRLPLEQIEKSITPRTRAIVVNSPGNPTGVTLSQSDLDAVTDLARRKGLWLVYDEIYSIYCYDAPHASLWTQPKATNGNTLKYEKSLILNGFSKSHAIPGWRMGYAFGPKDIVQEMLKIQQYSFVCAPSMAQWSMVDGLDVDTAWITERYLEKRNFIYDALSEYYDVVKPGGAFYIFPRAPKLGGREVGGQAFVEKCIENNLLVVPGKVFSQKDTHFRISFSASLEQLQRGAEILQRLARS